MKSTLDFPLKFNLLIYVFQDGTSEIILRNQKLYFFETWFSEKPDLLGTYWFSNLVAVSLKIYKFPKIKKNVFLHGFTLKTDLFNIIVLKWQIHLLADLKNSKEVNICFFQDHKCFLFHTRIRRKSWLPKILFKFYCICIDCGRRKGHEIFDKIKQMKEHTSDSR